MGGYGYTVKVIGQHGRIGKPYAMRICRKADARRPLQKTVAYQNFLDGKYEIRPMLNKKMLCECELHEIRILHAYTGNLFVRVHFAL